MECGAGGHRRGGALSGWVLLSASILLAGGCAHNPPGLYGGPGTSPASDRAWTPPAALARKYVPPPVTGIPPEKLAMIQSLTLPDIVDIALRNSTRTRIAWAGARAAAAAYGSTRGDYLPDVNVGISANASQGATFGGASTFTQKNVTASADLTWLLFNFGGRRADVEEARQNLVAADWDHNASIQDVILGVELAYYQYVTTHALRDAQNAGLKEAETNLDAAGARHDAGVATIADVLRARTARSQAQLILDSLEGDLQTTRGGLATAMGLPATTDFDVTLPPLDLPADAVLQGIDAYLAAAAASRPDLAAARAAAAAARAHATSVRAEGFPALTLSGTTGRVAYKSPGSTADTYTASLGIRFPLFTGFSHGYDVAEARAQADQAEAQLEDIQRTVTYQIWTSFYDVKTAEQRVRTSDDLLKSASESYDVAAGQYKAGVGTILDVLAAEAALDSARAQQVQARADWFMAMAQLAHDTGTLEREGRP